MMKKIKFSSLVLNNENVDDIFKYEVNIDTLISPDDFNNSKTKLMLGA
jgi:hypothetical protein